MKKINLKKDQRGLGAAPVLIGVGILVIIGIVFFGFSSILKEPDKAGDKAKQEALEEKKEDSFTIIDEQIIKKFILTGENFSFSENEIRVKKGDKVRIEFTSTEGFHDWAVDEFNVATDRVQTGATTLVEFTADIAGTFEYYCSVGEHRQLGMVGNLIVEE